jgi:hypothetical protein
MHVKPDASLHVQIVVVTDANRARPILEERGWLIKPLEIDY